MTTYYGVWSGEEWWNIGNELFHTTMVGLANAQAMVVNAMWKRNMMHSRRRHELWEVRAIGEDGLPVEKRPRPIVYGPCDLERGRIGCTCPRCELERSAAESNATELTEAPSHKCTICGDPAVNWLDFPRFWNKDKDAPKERMYLCTPHDECQLMIDSERLGRTVDEIVSAIRAWESAEAKSNSHECAWCGATATGWVQIAVRRWFHCDRCEAWAREASQSAVFQKRRKP